MKLMEFLQIAEERDKPPKGYPKDRSKYAVPEEYLFPLDTEKHVHSAITLFSKHKFKNEAQRKRAAKLILEAAKEYDISVSENTEVYKAAHGD